MKTSMLIKSILFRFALTYRTEKIGEDFLLPRFNTSLGRLLEISTPFGLAAIVACISRIAQTFYSNQNQYFAHVIGPSSPRLQSDWLVNTTDPYPVFTNFAKLVIENFGITGVMACAYGFTFLAVYAIFLIARTQGPCLSNAQLALITTLIGLTIPLYRSELSALNGVAGQYLINRNNILQPSSFGVLLLLAFPLWHQVIIGQATNSRRTYFVALALTTVACTVHYTYLIVTFASAFGVIVATWSQKNWKLTSNISFTTLGVGIVVALFNPQIFKFLGSTPEQDLAQRRFAFERIPNQTLITHWAKTDIVFAFVALVAILLLRSQANNVLMTWILVTSTIALGSAVVVWLTKSTQLALLFPWRVSVIVVPVALVAILCWLVPKLKEKTSLFF